jgi:hypothetical protein
VGTFRKPRMSDSQVCALYSAGEARDTICKRSGLLDREVCDVLRRNGIPLRCDAEWSANAQRNRARWKSTFRMLGRLGKSAA